jgi:hypothetical protein
LSHSSYSLSQIPSQHLCSESTSLQSSEHLLFNQFLFQLSHSSPGSFLPFQHDHLQFFTSLLQFEQSSAHSTIQFQQKLVQSFKSSLQFLQSSHFSTIPFQQTHGFSQSVIQISHKSSGQFSQFSFSFIFLFGQEYLSLQFAVQLYFLLLFLYLHKSHSSSHSFTPFPHTGLVEIIFVHLSLHLLGLSGVQFKSQSSHFSFHSLLLFQQIAFVLVHSKEHFHLYPLYGQSSHSSQTPTFQSQHFTLHFSPKSIGQVKQVSPGSIIQFPQLGFSGLNVVHIVVQALHFVQFFVQRSHSSNSLSRFQSQQ